ncbi:MAG: DNA polymerase III subunit delta [Bacteroidetes bacterium]|nr:MAG: DNA polymerase III subunit delta [Bacteroidota bacterium]
MTFEQIMEDLKKGSYHPIYFLYGEEPYYMDRITEYITKNVLTEAEKSFNQTIVYGKDSDAGQVIGLARRFPMMANRQVVVVREAQDLKDFENLVHYAVNPLRSTLLVINYKYKKPDNRKKVFSALAENGLSFESKKLYDSQVPAWISAYAGARKVTVEPKAAALLTEFLGAELSKIANELDKLFIVMEKGQRKITPVLVETHIGISKDFNQFELQNALGRKNAAGANRIIRYFAGDPRNHPMTVTLTFLYFFFSKLLIYHYTTDRSRQNIASTLKINPFWVKDYEIAARNYSATSLVGIISLLREYDMKSKGYGGTAIAEGELLRELIFKIMHR